MPDSNPVTDSTLTVEQRRQIATSLLHQAEMEVYRNVLLARATTAAGDEAGAAVYQRAAAIQTAYADTYRDELARLAE